MNGPADPVLNANDRLIWDAREPIEHGYTPCLVDVQARNDNPPTVTFRFVHTDNARRIGRVHTLPLDDYDLTHLEYASTLPDDDELADGRTISILMIGEYGLEQRADQQQPSATGLTYRDLLDDLAGTAAQGKWPRGSEGARSMELLRALIKLPKVKQALGRPLFEAIQQFLNGTGAVPLPLPLPIVPLDPARKNEDG